ncbi:MAG: pyridoxal phosphate-dependent aminotransferase [Leptospirales bacterium]
MKKDLSWVRSELCEMSGYSVLESPEGTIKLDAMENPFGLPEKVRSRLAEEVSALSFNRYPDAQARDLKEVVSRVLKVPVSRLFFGNGSDEVLLNLFLSTSGSIVAPEPTFSMYRIISKSVGRRYRGVSLLPDLTLDMKALEAVLCEEKPGILVLASPNNPTGTAYRMEQIGQAAEMASRAGFTTLLDEAYFPFHGESALDLFPNSEQILVLRTFSKMGLAGLRLGFLVAPEEVVGILDKIRLPYNMDALTQKAAVFLLNEVLPLLEEQVQAIRDLREQLQAEMSDVPGVSVIPSRANFILFRVIGKSPDEVFRFLLGKGVLVRDVSSHHPLLVGTLRVTVGTREENMVFLNALKGGMKS